MRERALKKVRAAKLSFMGALCAEKEAAFAGEAGCARNWHAKSCAVAAAQEKRFFGCFLQGAAHTENGTANQTAPAACGREKRARREAVLEKRENQTEEAKEARSAQGPLRFNFCPASRAALLRCNKTFHEISRKMVRFCHTLATFFVRCYNLAESKMCNSTVFIKFYFTVLTKT